MGGAYVRSQPGAVELLSVSEQEDWGIHLPDRYYWLWLIYPTRLVASVFVSTLVRRFWFSVVVGLFAMAGLFMFVSEYGDHWFTKAFGDIKIGDFIVAYFTYCLVVIGWFTLRSADLNSKRLERAYISVYASISPDVPELVKNAQTDGGITGDHLVNVDYYFINGGRTQASVYSASNIVQFMLHPNKDVWLLILPPEDKMDAYYEDYPVLPTDAADAPIYRQASSNIYLNQQRALEIASGEGRYEFKGKISYTDVFGEQHSTEFGYWMSKDGQLYPYNMARRT
jgi:hypothetical protein